MTEDQRTAHVEMNGHVIKGTYHGGAYIDLSFGDGPAFEVINVWDYVTDKPTIAFTSVCAAEPPFASSFIHQQDISNPG